MATGAVHGKDGRITISANVSEVSSWNATYFTDPADVPSFDSSGFFDRIPGLIHFDGTFETNVFLNKPGAQASALFKTAASATATKPTFSCNVVVGGIGAAVVVDDAIRWTYDFVSNGPVTIVTT